MPTGYTAQVADGTITTLKDYALKCARAFGALASLRDTPLSEPLVERLEPDPYYKEDMVESMADLKNFKSLNDKELQVLHKQEYSNDIDSYEKRLKKTQEEQDRYKRMLREVNEYVALSSDHIALKEFMKSQLEDSIKYDSYKPSKPKLQGFEEWKQDRMRALEQKVDYSSKAYNKELERTSKNNLWLQQLRTSLE